jgi:hypothetical protein
MIMILRVAEDMMEESTVLRKLDVNVLSPMQLIDSTMISSVQRDLFFVINIHLVGSCAPCQLLYQE